MKEIINYKGFTIEFTILKKVETYIKKKSIYMASILNDNWKWFEVILFDIIDENQDGIPDKKYGKNFQVILHDVLNISEKGKKQGFIKGIKFNNSNYISSGRMLINSKVVEYTILRK